MKFHTPHAHNAYVLQIEHFRKCIEKNCTALVRGEEGLKYLEVCVMVYKSARSEVPVQISQRAHST